MVLISVLFLRGKAAEASKDLLMPPPELSVQATNLAAVEEAEAAVVSFEPQQGTVRRHFTAEERKQIRHATINVPQ